LIVGLNHGLEIVPQLFSKSNSEFVISQLDGFGVLAHFAAPLLFNPVRRKETFLALLRMTSDGGRHPERSEGSGVKMSHPIWEGHSL
jgi:hypothetical protein